MLPLFILHSLPKVGLTEPKRLLHPAILSPRYFLPNTATAVLSLPHQLQLIAVPHHPSSPDFARKRAELEPFYELSGSCLKSIVGSWQLWLQMTGLGDKKMQKPSFLINANHVLNALRCKS